MRALSAVLLQLFIAPLVLAVSPRIAFERVLPAQHDLGGVEEVALVNARGEAEQVEIFVDELLRDLNRSQLIRARDIRFTTGPADAHLDVKSLTCTTSVREGEGSSRDFDGNKVRRRYETVEAICTARIDVLNRFMSYRSTFHATGAATSPRANEVTDEERKAAIERAARHAASDAADRITPRRVREAIWLDEQAPAFEEGFAMIEASRLDEARKIWEEALRTGGRSAPLRYNLGAVCEAMGDRRAAELHYNAARQLAPAEPRYTNEWKLFVRRGRP
jgi:tetratricopeptide (TPR) repeat protein